MRRFFVLVLMCLFTVAVYAFVPDKATPNRSAEPITIITPDPESLFLDGYRDEQITGLSEQEIREIADALDLGENVELLEDEPASEADALAEIEAVERELAGESDASQEQEVVQSAPAPGEQEQAPAPAADTATDMRTLTGRVDSSIYSTAVDAGLSPNQVARLTRLLKPHLDFSRELRKGDELTVQLDPESGEGSEDASQLYRIEFNGVRKHLLITRSDENPDYYEVRDDSGKLLESRSVLAKTEIAGTPEPEEQKKSVAKKPVKTATKNNTGSSDKRRLEATIDYSLFTAAREAGLTTEQTVKLRSILDPYIDYNKELRKGDRLVINLDKSGKTIQSIEYKGSKKQILAVQEENGDYAVTDHTGGSIKVATKKDAEKAGKKTVAKVEKTRKKQSTPMISGWKPRDKALARVYARILQSGKVNKSALQKAFKYYENNRYSRELSSKHIAIADYTQTALARRLHIIDLKSGDVKSYQVAHGRRSGPVAGRVHSVSNVVGSNKTSEGFFKVGFKEGRTRTKGYDYLPIEGLESGNRKVGLPTRLGGRDVIVHTASYVESGGRSNGCFAIRPQDKRQVFGKLKGALLLSYAG